MARACAAEGEWAGIFSSPLTRCREMADAVSAAVGEQVGPDTSAESLRKIADRHDVELQPGWGAGEIALELFEKLA